MKPRYFLSDSFSEIGKSVASSAISKYSNSNSGIVNAKQLQGKELSYNNLNDSDAAYNLILEFEKPACAIIKHANPCGAAIGSNQLS